MQRVCRLNPHRFPGGEINAEQNYYPQQQHGRHKTKQKTSPSRFHSCMHSKIRHLHIRTNKNSGNGSRNQEKDALKYIITKYIHPTAT